MNRQDKVIGINCFNDLLSLRDLKAYIQQVFPNTEYPEDKIIYYSKILNLIVTDDCRVHFLNSSDSFEIKNGQIKSIEIDGKEVLRIFDTNSHTCFTFHEDN